MYTEAWVVLTCGNDTVYNRVLERVQYSVVPSDPRRIRKDGTRIEFPVSVETQRATTQARILGQRFLEDRLDPQDRREVEMSVRTKVKEQKLTEGTSFTPGPWRAEYGRYGEQWAVIASNRTVVAQCSAGMTSDPEQGSRSRQFDAKLIAAAPEMFDLVQSALSLWGFMVNDLSLSKDERAAAQRNLEKARQVVGAITESTHSQPAPRLRPLRERMTRAEIESEFDIQDGIIKDPGKFEGEPVYAPYFYVLGMDSGADEDVYGADDTIHSVFFITDEDREQFPELKEEEIEALHVWEGETGFFNTEAVTREEWEAFKAQHESDEDEEFAESHNRPDSVRPPQTGETVYVGDVEIEFTRGGWYVAYHMAKDSDGEFLKKMKFDTWASALEYANSVADDEDFDESCRKGKKGKRVAPKLRGKSQSDGKPQKVEAKPLSRTPQDHQTAIAIRTLKMAAPMAGVMGGPSKEEARRYLLSIGWSQAKIDALTNSQSSRKEASQRRLRESAEVVPAGNLAHAKVEYSDSTGALVWRDEATGVTMELGAPGTAGNLRDTWEAGIRYRGWAKDSAHFDTREEATQWLDKYDLASVTSDSGPGRKFVGDFVRGLTQKETASRARTTEARLSTQKVQQKVESLTISEPTITQKRLLRTLLTVMAQEPRDHAILTPMPGSNVPSGYPNVSMAMWQSLSRNQLAKKAHNGVWYLTQRGSDALAQETTIESVVSEKKRKIDWGRLHQQGAKPETFNMPQHTVKGE